MLSIDFAERLGAFALEVALEVPARQTLALVGESGSGKTSVLRTLAGLIRPERGRIALHDEVWFDAARGIDRAAPLRNIGYVPQDYALFPHRTALDNVAFGLRASGVPRAPALLRARAALARFDAEAFAAQRPGELSGGQQQRVALARAVVLEPGLLLLDEPLAALDLQTRRSVRGELRRLLSGFDGVSVFVTHSPVEAMVFGDRIAVLDGGRVAQLGSADELVRHPRTGYVAAFMGVNLLRATVRQRTDDGLARVEADGCELWVPDPKLDGDVFVVLDPREIVLSLERPSGSARNVVRVTVTELVPEPPDGDRLRVTLGDHPLLVAEITRRAADAMALRPGLELFASFKASGATAFR